MKVVGKTSLCGCLPIPVPVLDGLVNWNHVKRKLTIRSGLVEPTEEFMRLSFGGEGTRLEPPARLTVIAVFDQLYNDRRLVVNGSSSAVLCHDTDYAGKWTGRAY